jgi:hypothetical protein
MIVTSIQAEESMIDEVTRGSCDRIDLPARPFTMKFREIKVPRNMNGSINTNIFSNIRL